MDAPVCESASTMTVFLVCMAGLDWGVQKRRFWDKFFDRFLDPVILPCNAHTNWTLGSDKEAQKVGNALMPIWTA